MAGLPEDVTERAKQILRNLESSELVVHGGARVPGRVLRSDMQLTMFEMKDDALRAALRAIDIDHLTPLEALKMLADLRAAAEQDRTGPASDAPAS
jgi:DNA mismatch repair protein MutS